MTHQKKHQPTKTCVRCGRPFTWRKKWAKDWEKVKYCSNRCRRDGNGRVTRVDSSES